MTLFAFDTRDVSEPVIRTAAEQRADYIAHCKTMHSTPDERHAFYPDLSVTYEVGGSDSYYATVELQLSDTGHFYDDAETEPMYDCDIHVSNNDAVSALDCAKAALLAVEKHYALGLHKTHRMIGDWINDPDVDHS